ncbi:MAG: hypothetical protein ACHQF0_00200 [Chitinophagales bacterium]
MKALKKISVIAVFLISLYCLPGCSTPSYTAFDVHYTNPLWAPPYYEGVRYYYLPDIEVYYDLTDEEFAYLDNGQWFFSSVLPPMYSNYDLFNGFVIALNVNVFQPWRHHQYYVSHYPRYYYHSFYRNADISNLRGFNENERKEIYWKQEERNRINDLRKNFTPEKKKEISVQPQQPDYRGKKIGHPVKVRPEMRENKNGNRRPGDHSNKPRHG